MRNTTSLFSMYYNHILGTYVYHSMTTMSDTNGIFLVLFCFHPKVLTFSIVFLIRYFSTIIQNCNQNYATEMKCVIYKKIRCISSHEGRIQRWISGGISGKVTIKYDQFWITPPENHWFPLFRFGSNDNSVKKKKKQQQMLNVDNS